MTLTTPRKRFRPWGAASVVAVGLVLAAGCSSAPAPPGEQAAQDTRVAVAGEYWRVLAVIVPQLFSGPGGAGQFTTCEPASGGTATQVSYVIENDLLPQSAGGGLTPAAFTAKLEQLLQAHGWSAFTAVSGGNGTMTSTSGGYHLQLRPVSGQATALASLTVSGPCVTVGAKFAAAAPHMNLNDTYANADVTASPTPTQPLPTP